MRLIVTTLVLALGACGSESQPQQRAEQAAPTAATGRPTTGGAGQSTPLMAVPKDPKALKRLEAMGYTVHEEHGHLHAPGVNSCPAMGDGPAM